MTNDINIEELLKSGEYKILSEDDSFHINRLMNLLHVLGILDSTLETPGIKNHPDLLFLEKLFSDAILRRKHTKLSVAIESIGFAFIQDPEITLGILEGAIVSLQKHLPNLTKQGE